MTNNQRWRPGKRVAIIGAGPGGVSAALSLVQQGYDVRIFERWNDPRPLGGGVLLSVPVLAVLRHYGIDINQFGSFTRTEFRNHRGKLRCQVKFNPEIERRLGIPGWHYGVLRASAFQRMLNRLQALDADVITGGMRFTRYEEQGEEVVVHFDNHEHVVCDLLIGADGIHSQVSRQAFGDPQLFHTGLRLWLAWCGDVPGIPKNLGRIHHSARIQASFFPMLHDGQPGFEWWVVEPQPKDAPAPSDPREHVRRLLADFVEPMPRFLEHTDFERNCFMWDIHNRPSLDRYTQGRIACVGDAVHPVSPYAAYGMGMAIEDGYFLTRTLAGRDLRDPQVVASATTRYNEDRVAFCNHNVEFARMLGDQFHRASPGKAWLRDLVFDHTPLLQKMIDKGGMEETEKMTLQLREVHVVTG